MQGFFSPAEEAWIFILPLQCAQVEKKHCHCSVINGQALIRLLMTFHARFSAHALASLPMWALALQIFCLLPISESPEIRKISFACSNFHKMWAKTPNSGNNCQRQFFHLAKNHRIFVPPCEKPGGICGQLALPQSCWGSVGLRGWVGPPARAPHTWLSRTWLLGDSCF